MESVHRATVVDANRSISLTDLPFEEGQLVEVVVRRSREKPAVHQTLTARALLGSGLVGIWADREDLADGAAFARRLREKAQSRSG